MPTAWRCAWRFGSKHAYIIANSLFTVRQFLAVLTVLSFESNQALVSLLFPAPFGRCR